jgi:hypothetical protein
MVVVPVDTAYTLPVEGLAVAIAVLALDHVPPPTEFVNTAEPPAQRLVKPEIVALTVL